MKCSTTAAPRRLARALIFARKKFLLDQSGLGMIVSAAQVRRKYLLLYQSRVSFGSDNSLLKNWQPDHSQSWFECGLWANDSLIRSKTTLTKFQFRPGNAARCADGKLRRQA
jgi:hypothetical protein